MPGLAPGIGGALFGEAPDLMPTAILHIPTNDGPHIGPRSHSNTS